MIILIRTQVGLFMGQIASTDPLSEIHNPCIVDFIPVPTQGRMGQSTIGIMRSVSAWPERTLFLCNLGPHVYSIIEDLDSEFVKLYQKTVSEAWPPKKIN